MKMLEQATADKYRMRRPQGVNFQNTSGDASCCVKVNIKPWLNYFICILGIEGMFTLEPAICLAKDVRKCSIVVFFSVL
jgi:hypothetical protein